LASAPVHGLGPRRPPPAPRRSPGLPAATSPVVYLGLDPVDPRARRFEVVAGELLAVAAHAPARSRCPRTSAARPAPTPADADRYQTLYAAQPGSVAAPTAGLHWEPEVLARLDLVRITLHVGPGTFLPMEAADVRDHRVGAEQAEISAEAAARILAARAAGRPIVAIGTTATRALEAVAARTASWSRHAAPSTS
jgi:S-adenosylmethionine:tRNA ribosyltransferase-isomerase